MRRADAVAHHRLGFKSPSRDGKPATQRADLIEVGAEVDERAECHVAGDAGEAVEPDDGGHLSSRNTALAAPKPLSMPTTVMPAAHEDNMAKSAVTPSSAAPYPAEVGTATTGAGVRPPTMLASAPSIPATTITMSALNSSSVTASSRCTPATPTSLMRTASMPLAHNVVAHSSATGRSAVPAVMTSTRSDRGAFGRHTTIEPRCSPPGFASSAAAACSVSARVSRTGDAS